MDIALVEGILPYFLEAAGVTVAISLLSFILGMILAATLTAMRLSPSRTLRSIGSIYVSIFRGTPCLVQLFLLYFGGPQIGINLSPFTAGWIGLGINIAAYMAESMRGAILAVDKGQSEAARTIGFGRIRTMWLVILPQSARLMIRPLGVNTVALIKGSSLVSAISVVDLAYTAQRYISSTFRPFEIFAVAALLYMLIIVAVSMLVRLADRRFAID
ncbi:amino acid ABC transporter permease [Sinorhizobium meliloti]|uniref:ABC transporter permease subunit n=1 Tax=Rhizobium meliloti TaxID=382 RepID=A0AAW9TJR2_RHIML|nr:amino acid ABC transporter permease [Sinorhizobium meliloti]MQW32245.1 ABC transporter permease subunit [Sinorhizobium meliloti]